MTKSSNLGPYLHPPGGYGNGAPATMPPSIQPPAGPGNTMTGAYTGGRVPPISPAVPSALTPQAEVVKRAAAALKAYTPPSSRKSKKKVGGWTPSQGGVG